ncbi:MAG: PhnD/SsuA/transferrin family substrate-binding protein [Polyangiaceae bacterium]|nr:PhnD/SsuA/transferrin family substrate-binding protein [Polyangiaceae bacterium]
MSTGHRSVRVGIAFASHASELRSRLGQFCSALGAALGMRSSGLGVWHYHRLLEALEMGDVDVAWLPPILAAQAAERGRVVPILLPVRGDAAFYSTALFTRENAPWKTPADLKGVRVAWVDRRSAAGYLVIRAHLRKSGVDIESAFGADQFLGAHDAVARAVHDGEADVGATFAHFDPETGALVRGGWGPLPMRVIASAGPIPSDVIATGTHVPPELRSAIVAALTENVANKACESALALFTAERFLIPDESHLAPLKSLLSDLDEHARRLPPQAPKPSSPIR